MMTHPAQALLDEQQQLNRWCHQISLEQRALALLLERELRQLRAAKVNANELPPMPRCYCCLRITGSP
jgi:hypothetical protein